MGPAISIKDKIRREMIYKRKAHGKEDRVKKSRIIKCKLFSLEKFLEASLISFYLSMETEVGTHEMIKEALALGKRVVVPFIDSERRKLILSELEDPDKELVVGPYTILQPHEKYLRAVPVALVELVVMPGLAFDCYGHRLGFGKGYYDRLLSHKGQGTTCVGLAFQFQLLEEIPAGAHDAPVDIIITEEMVLRTGS